MASHKVMLARDTVHDCILFPPLCPKMNSSIPVRKQGYAFTSMILRSGVSFLTTVSAIINLRLRKVEFFK